MKPIINGQLLVVFACLLTFVVSAAAQADFSARIDEHVRGVMQKQNVPGIALAVVRDGQVVLSKGYGFANLEHQVPARPESVFQSGSVGKQFTAAAVMLLVEEGKIGLDEKISKYLGEVPDSWKDVTVRHLLTHTSGMTDYPRDFDFRRDYTEDELLKIARSIPTAFQPGEKFQYSNIGYVTLGIIIGKVTGQFYGDFLQQRIFRPLGMTTARIINEADIIPNRAAGYVLAGGELKNQEWVSPTLNTTADGALYLTVFDLAKWDAALYGEKLLKKSSLEQMWTPVRLNSGKTHDYGFGWMLGKAGDRRLISHGGAWQGFMAHIGRYVDDKLTIIVLANRSGFNTGRLAAEIAGIIDPRLAPPVLKPIEDKEPRVTARAKELLRMITGGSIEGEEFTPEAREFLTPERVRTVGQTLKSLGSPKQFDLVERTDDDETRIYRYRLTFESAAVIYTLRLAKDDKISAVQFRPE